jgi:hypothetical protein
VQPTRQQGEKTNKFKKQKYRFMDGKHNQNLIDFIYHERKYSAKSKNRKL